MRSKIVRLALFVLRKIRESELACGRASTFISRLPTAVEVACSGSQIVGSERKSGRTIEKNEAGSGAGGTTTPQYPFVIFFARPLFYSPLLFYSLEKATVGENELTDVPKLM